MRTTTICKVASLAISSVMIQHAVAGHAVGIGVGPHFGHGRFGGRIFGMLFNRGGYHSAPASGGGARVAFGGGPTFEQPRIVRSPSRITTSPGRLTRPSHQRDPISSRNHQSTPNPATQSSRKQFLNPSKAANRSSLSPARKTNKGSTSIAKNSNE
jgi:hypothetical protein